jgi:hypothetical protein
VDLIWERATEKEKSFTAQQLVATLPACTYTGPVPTRLFVAIGLAG